MPGFSIGYLFFPDLRIHNPLNKPNITYQSMLCNVIDLN